ncbi:MAG TPA: hypothetical protein VLE49_15925 [Anaerolineales bacterium]|nr:hypothetical protein [Anaerolineales bacterium]
MGREDAVAIMDEETVTVVGRDRFSQLLQGPSGGGVSWDITMHDPPDLMFNDNQDIE